MPEDVFRIVVAAAVVLAAIAFVAQAATVAALSRAVRKMQEKAEPLMDKAAPVIAQLGPAIARVQVLADKAGPVLEKAGPMIEQAGRSFAAVVPLAERGGQVLESARQILDENRPRIAGLTSDAAAIARTGREQAERLAEMLQETSDSARARLDRIEGAMDSAVEQVEQAGDLVKRAVMRPVREANGLAAGISAAVSTLMRGRKYSPDSATQDEEMFI